MNESDEYFTAPIFDSERFKQRVADEMGLDLNNPKQKITVTKIGDTLYRIDLSIGKYHANSVATVLSIEEARIVANGFKACVKKWANEVDNKDIVLSEDPMHHISVKNRRLDTESPIDAAVFEFVFRYNLKVYGLSDEEIAEKWKQSPWYKE